MGDVEEGPPEGGQTDEERRAAELAAENERIEAEAQADIAEANLAAQQAAQQQRAQRATGVRPSLSEVAVERAAAPTREV